MSKKEPKAIQTGMTLYDLNKQMMAQKDPLPALALAQKQEELEEWFNWRLDGYAMLLCNERHDYTVFHLYEKQNPNPPSVAASELIGCLTDRGKVLAIDKRSDGNYEIWLKIENEIFMYMLFPCDDFVIEC